MTAIEAILSRRSVRAYEKTPVETDKLEKLLECAINAPSANNMQNWHFTLITDDAALRAFEDEFSAQSPAHGDEWKQRADAGYKVLHGAPAAILVSAAEPRDINAGIAAENICVAATELGLGTCIIGLVRMVFEGPNGDAWARRLACPVGLKPALMVSIGYPAPGGTREKTIKAELISRI